MGLIRLLLALAVFNAHASCIGVKIGLHWLSPFMAVRSFYAISGFYMAMVIVDVYSKMPDGAKRFYINRGVRLFPAYWLVFAVALILELSGQFATPVQYLWAGSKAYEGSESLAYSAISFLNDLLLLPAALQLSVYSGSLQSPLSTEVLIAPAYTVGVEMLFYALAPAIVTRGWKVLTALLAASILLHLAPLAMGLPWRPFQFDFFPGVLVFFVAGVIAYRLFAWARPRIAAAIEWLRARTQISGAPLLICYGLVAILVFATKKWLPWQESGVNNLKCLAFYAGILVLTPFAFALTAKSRLDRWLGDLSYPLYIVHYPILLWVAHQQIADVRIRNVVTAGLVCVLTLTLTLAVERPLQSLRSRNRSAGTSRKSLAISVPAEAPVGHGIE